MNLRTKCLLLLIAFELTLAATLLFTVRHIGAYFDDAANSFAQFTRTGVDLGRLRGLVRDELLLIQRQPANTDAANAGHYAADITAALTALRRDSVPPLSEADVQELDRLLAARDRRLPASAQSSDAEVTFNPEGHLAVDAWLGALESRVNDGLRNSVEASFSAQKRAALILSVNMIVAAGIGIAGMILVRRWVLLPVRELIAATDEFGKGRLDHRARILSHDELGRLAQALNKMSADLARIEKQMVLRERAAAMGELISYVAHNIRNPLAGIRSLCDSCLRQTPPGSPLRTPHAEIIAAIERLQRWLREMEHTCKPLEITPVPAELPALIDNIAAVFKPMADRRRVQLNIPGQIGLSTVSIDERHFEQAVAAIVGNAIEATPEGGTVTIDVVSNGEDQWELTVANTGRSVPEELRERIFEPAFTTKHDGTGMGLSMARKVTELHGGRLVLESPDNGGAVFRLVMPKPT